MEVFGLPWKDLNLPDRSFLLLLFMTLYLILIEVSLIESSSGLV